MNKHLFTLTVLLLLLASLVSAQVVKNNIVKSSNKIEGVTATGDKVLIKDGNTTLLEITNEGNTGSILMPNVGALSLSSNTDKLYNNNGSLFWNGSSLGTAGSAGGWTHESPIVKLSSINDNVGIGTINPLSKLSVGGDGISDAIISGIASDFQVAVYAHATGTSTTGIYSEAPLTGWSGQFVGNVEVSNYLWAHGNDGVLFEGTYQQGNIPREGRGTRMMWYPKKRAFRAGYVHGTQWDDDNIGASSTAMGFCTTASGVESVAMGTITTASGVASTAMGSATIASGVESVAMGNFTKAQSYTSTALGQFNVGGGTANSWVDTDPLFEIGNGVDFDHRSNAVTVLKNGNVGIGTTTPGDNLAIKKDADAFVGIDISNNNTESSSSEGIYFSNEAGTVSGIRLYDNDNTYSSQMHIFNNRPDGSIHLFTPNGHSVFDRSGNFAVYSGDILIQGLNSFKATNDEAVLFLGDNNNYIKGVWGYGIKLNVYGTTNTAISVLAGSGNVGIGTETPSRKLYVNGSAGGTENWNASSDRRLKKNIKTIPNALEKINNLRGVNFEWRDQKTHSEGLKMGFIAQEAKGIIPEVVEKKGEYYSMQYAPITALLVEAVKEQDKRIDKLEEENNRLKTVISENNNLRDEINTIKTALNNLVKQQQQVKISSK